MKKLIALTIIIAMFLSFSTMSFAEDKSTEENPYGYVVMDRLDFTKFLNVYGLTYYTTEGNKVFVNQKARIGMTITEGYFGVIWDEYGRTLDQFDASRVYAESECIFWVNDNFIPMELLIYLDDFID